jgi:hypothetical protein
MNILTNIFHRQYNEKIKIISSVIVGRCLHGEKTRGASTNEELKHADPVSLKIDFLNPKA